MAGPEELRRMVAAHYRDVRQRERYEVRARLGLHTWERTLARRYLDPPGRLLDIGCGAGREALALCALGHGVVGVDTSPELLAAARANARDAGVELEVLPCDGERLEFPDGSFDYIVAWSQVLAHVPGARARADLVGACARVLRPGGRLTLSVHDRERTEVLAREQGLIRADPGLPLEEGDYLLGDASGDPCYWHYFTPVELLELCWGAGLHVLEYCPVTELGQDYDNVWACVAQR